MKESIFKAYDIRGLYPSEIDEDAAYKIGRALVIYTKAKKVAVGRDMRVSSPSIEEALVRGITDQGADAVKIGLSSTPLVYFASGKLGVDAAVNITASHNTAEFNGMKMCIKNAVPVAEGAGMEEIRDMVVKGGFSTPEKKGEVSENKEIRNIFLDYIAGFFKKGLNRKKIIIDFGNGMGATEKELYERFPDDLEVVSMFEELDGNFPNHESNPLKTETLADLQKKVLKEKADLGIAYDGDADRVGFVDEKGEVISMDFVGALLAKEILKNNPGGLVLIDLRSSNAVREYIEEAGGQVHLCRVGHSPIKKQIREEGAIFASELSGHYYFRENFNAEMASLAAVNIINLINETGRKISELTQELKRYFQSGEINSKVEDKQKVLDKLKEKYADGKIIFLDGIRVDYSDWWFNVRCSNTESVIRLNLEAKTKELMEEKRDELLKLIRE